MWTKILGAVCAGLFVGAALYEYKQIKHHKDEDDGHDDEAGPAAGEEPQPSPGGAGDEPAPVTP